MLKTLKRAWLVTALVAGAMTTATAAEAHDRDHNDDTAAIAIGAGIIGLAVGAAIASNNDRYYGGPAYGYYYPPPRVYYRGYPRPYYRAYPRGYYHDRYPQRIYRYDPRWERRLHGHAYRHRGW